MSGATLRTATRPGLLRWTVELGWTLIDVADAYGPESDERSIAEALPLLCRSPLADGELSVGIGALAASPEARGLTPAQVTLAWLLARLPATLPIPGTESPSRLEQNLGPWRPLSARRR